MADIEDGMVDRRAANIGILERRLDAMGREMVAGFNRMEAKIDSNLESLSDRIERQGEKVQAQMDANAQRATDRAEALAVADHGIKDAMDARVTMLEGKMEQRLADLEKWRVEATTTITATRDLQGKGVQTKHLWFAAIGLVLTFGGMLLTVVGIVVTILLTQ